MSSAQPNWWSTDKILLTKPGSLFNQFHSKLKDPQCIGVLYQLEFKLRELARLQHDNARLKSKVADFDCEIENLKKQLDELDNDHLSESSVSSIPEQEKNSTIDGISEESLDDVSSQLSITSSNSSAQDIHVSLDVSITLVTPSSTNDYLTSEKMLLNTCTSTTTTAAAAIHCAGDATILMDTNTTSAICNEVVSTNTIASNPMTDFIVPTTATCNQVASSNCGLSNTLTNIDSAQATTSDKVVPLNIKKSNSTMEIIVYTYNTTMCKEVALPTLDTLHPPETFMTSLIINASTHQCNKLASNDVIPLSISPETVESPVNLITSSSTPITTTNSTTATLMPVISDTFKEVPTLTKPSTPTGSVVSVNSETSSPFTAVSATSILSPLCSSSSSSSLPSSSSSCTAVPIVADTIEPKRKSRFRFPSFSKMKKFFSSLKFKH